MARYKHGTRELKKIKRNHKNFTKAIMAGPPHVNRALENRANNFARGVYF